MIGLALAECVCVKQTGGVLVRQWMTGDAWALVNIKDSGRDELTKTMLWGNNNLQLQYFK